MRVLVCGGRDYNNKETFHETLLNIILLKTDYTGHDVTIIAGGARGADTLAEEFANHYNCPFTKFPADWNKYGKKAGMIRNYQMLVEGKPDLVVAFPGGRGTEGMVVMAKKANIEVIEVERI